MPARTTFRSAILAVAFAAVTPVSGPSPSVRSWPALGPGDIDDIARLVMFEDRREFDVTQLTRLLTSPHPEVRRRAAVTVGRLADRRGIALLLANPLDPDTAIAATVVFAVGQIRDSLTVPWLDSLLTSPASPPTVVMEAAIALGKIKTAGARAALGKYLTTATANGRTTRTIGEALLSFARAVPRGDNTPVMRWTTAPSDEIRWRATWALFRPHDPAATSTLITLAKDKSAIVRSWALRALARPQADSAGLASQAEAALFMALSDKDRSARTEAIRALGTYSDSAAVAALMKGLESQDTWIATSAAEGLGRARSPASINALVLQTRSSKSCALRIISMQSLQMFAPEQAVLAALDVVRDTVPHCRTIAAQTLTRAMGAQATPALTPGMRAQIAAALDTLRRNAVADLKSDDVLHRVAALRAVGALGDSTQLEQLRGIAERGRLDSLSPTTVGALAAITAIERRTSGAGRGGGGGGRQGRPPPVLTKTLADYRAIVERWVVPDYNNRPHPTAHWETSRGVMEIELYPGDAPLATDDFVRTMNAGTIVGSQFTRVVPDFVDQEESIRSGNTLRDEVNRHGLTRENLAWATAGLDTGTPGYTLGHTPQPHNEGDFTSLGRVRVGMDVADRIELGDRIIAVRMNK